jgi:ubiquinone/menaquinone biosynthesis C-methylase UbiE
LEHLRNAQQALKEMARVMKPSGQLIITFPHRKFYFANDDCFVGHFRRYELHEMQDRLTGLGLRPVSIQKVLGPLGEDNHVR